MWSTLYAAIKSLNDLQVMYVHRSSLPLLLPSLSASSIYSLLYFSLFLYGFYLSFSSSASLSLHLSFTSNSNATKQASAAWFSINFSFLTFYFDRLVGRSHFVILIFHCVELFHSNWHEWLCNCNAVWALSLFFCFILYLTVNCVSGGQE